MSTTLVRKEDVQRKWYVLDAADKPLGRTEFAMELAVKGMLPKNTIGRTAMTRLKLFKGPEHIHAAQKPEAWTQD